MLWLLESHKGELHEVNFFDDAYIDKVFVESDDYFLSACGEARPPAHVHQWYHFHENAPRYCDCGEYEGGVAAKEAAIDAAHMVHNRRR